MERLGFELVWKAALLALVPAGILVYTSLSGLLPAEENDPVFELRVDRESGRACLKADKNDSTAPVRLHDLMCN